MRSSSFIALIALLTLGIGPWLGPLPRAAADTHVIVLEDGTSFSGTIVAENKRQVSILTGDGATVAIPIGVIKTFDGRGYNGGELVSGLPEVPPAPDTTVQEKKLSRPSPSSPVKPGSSIEVLLAALKGQSKEERSSAAREIARRGQWTTETVIGLEALFTDTIGQADIPSTFPGSADQDHAKLLAPGWEAAHALAVLGPQGYGELASLTGNARGLIRERAAWGLGATHNRAAVPVLVKLLEDSDPYVRAAATTALRFSEAVPAIAGKLSDRDERVRLTAVSSLAGIGDSASVKSIIRALADPSPQVRSSAVAALGRLKARPAILALSMTAADAVPEVRLAAVYAMARIRDPQSVPALITALRDRDGSVRKAAAAALGDMRDPRATVPLRTALQESPDSVKPAIRIALKQHTDVPLLIGALDDNDTLVRRNAEYLLWIITGKKLGFDKKAWADWFVNSSDAGEKSSFSAPAPSDTSFIVH